jgi:hypothetical protein
MPRERDDHDLPPLPDWVLDADTQAETEAGRQWAIERGYGWLEVAFQQRQAWYARQAEGDQ